MHYDDNDDNWQDIEFADDYSKCIYDEAFGLFKSSNRGRDEKVDFTVEYNLPSYVKELAIRDPNKKWMTSTCFTLATCFCLTWPYRWLLNSSKNEYHYRIVKKVTVSPTQPILPTGHPVAIDISNIIDQPLIAVVPVTPPPPYEEWVSSEHADIKWSFSRICCVVVFLFVCYAVRHYSLL